MMTGTMKVDFEEKNLKRIIENYRQRVKIDQDFNVASGCIHKVANSKDELEAAYTLVHDAFVKRGYIEPQPSGIRVSVWNAAPGCTTIISKNNNNQVLATATLFPDSDLGLPMDRIFNEELQYYRQENTKIVEIGNLASIIADQKLVFQLYKLLLLYSERFLGADALAIAVHPKRIMFYKALLDFKQIGPVKSYPAVNNNPAIPLIIRFKDLHTSIYDENVDARMSKIFYRNIYNTKCSCIQFPDKKSARGSWNADLFRYFLFERTNLFKTVDKNTLLNLEHGYEDGGPVTGNASDSFSN